MQKEVTIYDLAKALNLSPATISRGLRKSSALNEATVERILAEAEKTGYRHNNFASNLRKQQTKTIGIIVHELNSNFIAAVLSGIEKVSTESGYDLIISHSAESFKKEAANVINLYQKRVDGLIASLSLDSEGLDHFKPFFSKNIPVIFFDRVEEQAPYAKVIIDNYNSGYQATQHLIAQGCKRIVLVTANLNRNVYAQRFKGYKDALKDYQIPFNEDWVLIKDLSEKCGREAAEKILSMNPLPDAAFITNDFSAAVCIQTLKENGIRIPEDIAIVGFNNDAISKIVTPQLTTINYPGIEIGEIAARQLIAHIKGESNLNDNPTTFVNADLCIRKSSLRKG